MDIFTVHEDGIFTIKNVLTADECDAYIALAEGLGFGEAPITTIGGAVRVPEVRDNDRVMLDDPARALDLWSRVEVYIPEGGPDWRVVGLNERLRFYRYENGQSFKWHYDGAFTRANGERSFLTFMVYLNDDFTGGDTEFTSLAIRPVKGTALVFVHHQLHQGAPVVKGRKYVLRSDVMYSPLC